MCVGGGGCWFFFQVDTLQLRQMHAVLCYLSLGMPVRTGNTLVDEQGWSCLESMR